MARNAEPIETDLVELIALDHKSYFAADFRSPLHRQGIKPLDESRHRPVAFPQRTRILRMRKPIEVRSLCNRQWRLAKAPSPQEESDYSCHRQDCQHRRELECKPQPL
jgi:hypothetical protein